MRRPGTHPARRVQGQTGPMSIRDIEVTLPDGSTTRFGDLAPGAAVVVNVASKCGFTPQYEGLEALASEFSEQGLTVVGMPCNQFMKQEPGTNEEIAEFCQVNYGVTFPLLSKSKVNGRNTHPLYTELKRAKDGAGLAGPVLWNFEKFVVGTGDEPEITRFRSTITPESPEFRSAITDALGS